MLVEFRVANFRSFREEQIFSLVASKDEKLPGNLITTPRFNLLKSAAVYGANASGKSNLVKAIQFFDRFVMNSATTLNQGDPIAGISPFRLDAESRAQPTAFEFTAFLDGSLYRYGFSITTERVHDEWLVVTPSGGRKQGWFERRYSPETNSTIWNFRGPLEKDQTLLKERTRDNGLALSRGAELNVEALNKLFLWFRRKLRTISSPDDVHRLFIDAMEMTRKSQAAANKVTRMIRDADLGIERLEISERPLLLKELSSDAPDELRRLALAINSDPALAPHRVTRLSSSTFHRIRGSQLLEEFDLMQDESNGTIRFFLLANALLNAVESGATVFVDEIDCSMHPLLSRKLIELFQSPEVNKSGAQLVFTTHDSSLMDLDLFRRDQIWIAEKNAAFATELSSLYDFQERRPRNTEAVERNYLAGRYGGVPHFGATFEDLELK